MLIVKFDTDNAAFDGDNLAPECARILRQIADRIEQGNVGNFRTILDCNGNDVGRWKLETTDDDGHHPVHYASDDSLSRR